MLFVSLHSRKHFIHAHCCVQLLQKQRERQEQQGQSPFDHKKESGEAFKLEQLPVVSATRELSPLPTAADEQQEPSEHLITSHGIEEQKDLEHSTNESVNRDGFEREADAKVSAAFESQVFAYSLP